MSEQDYLAIIGKNIKMLIEAKHYSQAEFARRMDVTPQAVSNWINGATNIRMDKIDKMCKVLNCSRSDLMEEKSEKTRKNEELIKRLMLAGGRLPEENLEAFVLAIEAAVKACENASKKKKENPGADNTGDSERKNIKHTLYSKGDTLIIANERGKVRP